MGSNEGELASSGSPQNTPRGEQVPPPDLSPEQLQLVMQHFDRVRPSSPARASLSPCLDRAPRCLSAILPIASFTYWQLAICGNFVLACHREALVESAPVCSFLSNWLGSLSPSPPRPSAIPIRVMRLILRTPCIYACHLRMCGFLPLLIRYLVNRRPCCSVSRPASSRDGRCGIVRGGAQRGGFWQQRGA